ncbi:essential MCU regulator, mitochondrial [Drosophila grimshawi]|uniref:Essential MCU regulator, mitochondrial n=1 Tax=Drosophila grimshawi TaxID=7222 RepID=B4J5I1_DROGR|nr:essential MCU regulator, mitochondrial [Drosophila grimshawi]EDW00744.1 GH20849 [Drosophila grimshawi]
MIVSRLTYPLNVALQQIGQQTARSNNNIVRRQMSGVQFRSGALKPKPSEMPFGLFAIFCAVIPGLFVGATISKNVANFLEENDLFVPSDDDDDED